MGLFWAYLGAVVARLGVFRCFGLLRGMAGTPATRIGSSTCPFTYPARYFPSNFAGFCERLCSFSLRKRLTYRMVEAQLFVYCEVHMTGQELVERWAALIARYVQVSKGQALVLALWALNTWVYERFPVTPYLEIWAMHKRSGKSTLAEILSLLSRGGRVLATVRVLSMVKLIEAKEGAYVPFIEEAERFEKGNLGDERSILASGYRRGAKHELEKADYRTFSPKAFVLIGNVHDILRDRCISIKLERGTPASNWTLERYTAEAEIDDLIVAWRDVAKHSLDVIKTDDGPRFKLVDPDWLTSARDREIWTPLFSLAHALKLHKDTLEVLQRASVDLSILKSLPPVKYHPAQEEHVSDDANAAEAVLRDIRNVIKPGEVFIPTEQVVDRLHAIPTAPWRAWRGDGLNAITLAALMERFGLKPEVARVGKGRKDSKTVRGYKVKQLQDVKL